ncbi:hypothetical protein CA14_001463 [Aspergillus flavus]|uniref:Uncharacterized protein n=1 Tax=Aspergillus flavus TaxID=5059 RepID=A0AB74C691_ASPFL|nr:hypothetical protein CA14_001463 [Aspergillus flavus]
MAKAARKVGTIARQVLQFIDRRGRSRGPLASMCHTLPESQCLQYFETNVKPTWRLVSFSGQEHQDHAHSGTKKSSSRHNAFVSSSPLHVLSGDAAGIANCPTLFHMVEVSSTRDVFVHVSHATPIILKLPGILGFQTGIQRLLRHRLSRDRPFNKVAIILANTALLGILATLSLKCRLSN